MYSDPQDYAAPKPGENTHTPPTPGLCKAPHLAQSARDGALQPRNWGSPHMSLSLCLLSKPRERVKLSRLWALCWMESWVLETLDELR